VPAAIPLIITAIAEGTAAITTGMVVTAIVGTMLQIAAYVVAQSMKPAEQETDLASQTTTTNNGILLNTESTDECLPLVYGRTRVGINRVYRATSDTDNKYLHIVGTIAEGEIQGVVQEDSVDQIWLDDTLISDALYSGKTYYEIYNGTQTQNVSAALKAACPEWNDAMRGTAYIYLRLEYDEDVFTSVPKITMLIDGIKTIYNPSTEATEYTNNPALCARDFITRSSRRGGMGINESRLDDDSFAAAAAYCATKGWTCGLPINEYQAAADNLSQILSCFRGALIYSGNEYKLKYRDLNYETSVMDVDEHDVVCSETGESSLKIHQPSIFDTPNGVCIKFIDAELNYQSNEYVHADNALIEADGDYREETITIKGINSLMNAMKMAYYQLERWRFNKTVDFNGHSRLLALEPMDLINLTHEIPGWESKQLRVENIGFDQNMGVEISLIEESVDFYDDEYDVSEHTKPDTSIIKPNTRPPAVTGVTLTEDVYYYRERSFTRLLISFTPPSASVYPFWKEAEVWVKIGTGDYKYMTRVRDNYIIDPVNEGETYYVKLVSVNIWDVKQLFSSASQYSKAIEGKTDQPTDLASLTAVASGDTVLLSAPRVSDPDIEGYEARLGSVWNGAILFGYNKEPLISKSGVRPGTHNFVMSPKSNNGLYSASPPTAQCTVFYPSGYSDKNSWSWDFSTGSHDNTEQTTYSGDNVLKCSHTDGVLSGTWTSPEYDLGSIKTVRVWGDFLTTFISAGNTWDAIFPSGQTWDDVAPAGTKWQDLVAIETKAVVLSAKIMWGDTSGNLTNEADFFEILAPEFSARYVQVEVTIIDPVEGSNLYLKTLNMKAAYWA
jgi:hypothetical protein